MPRSRYYVRLGDDGLDDTSRFTTKANAVAFYGEHARELDRYGQRLDASIHMAPTRAECVEYPDFVLSLGPRGGIRCDRA